MKKVIISIIFLSNIIFAQVASNMNTGIEYWSINDAVTAANPGDTIVAYSVAQFGPVNITKDNLTITTYGWLTASDNTTTTFNGTFVISGASGTHIEGFSLTPGYPSIRINSSSSGNTICNNIIDTGDNGIVIQDNSEYNIVCSNQISTHTGYGIHLDNARYNNIFDNDLNNNYAHNNNNPNGIRIENNSHANLIYNNSIQNYGDNGIRIGNSRSNMIHNNYIYHCTSQALNIDTGSHGTMIFSNEIYGTNPGGDVWDWMTYECIRLVGCDDVIVYRNLIVDARYNGIVVDNGARIRIYNNTICSNELEDGIRCMSGASDVYISNNLIAYNGNGVTNETGGDYGIQSLSASGVYADYNFLYNPLESGDIDPAVIAGPNNVTGTPPVFSNHYELSPGSAPVDQGTTIPGITAGYMGTAPDPGWKEGLSLVVDSTPPVINITAPTISETIGGSYSFTGSTTEDLSTILSNVLVITNPAGTPVLIRTMSAGTWSENIDTTALASGTYGVFVYALNSVGLSATTGLEPFYINNSSLKLAETNIADGQIISGTVSFIGYATNSFSGNDPNILSVQAGNADTLTVFDTNTAFSIDVDTGGMTDGPEIVVFRAVSGDNKTNTLTNTVIVDNSAPLMSVSDPVSMQTISGNYNIQGTLSDPHSGVISGMVSITNSAGILITNYSTTADWNFDLDTSVLADGLYSAYISATNGALISAVSAPLVFEVINNTFYGMETNVTENELITGIWRFAGYASNSSAALNPPAIYGRVDSGTYTFLLSNTSYAMLFDTVPLSDGSHSFDFRAISANGSTNEFSRQVLVDNSPPSIGIVNLQDGDEVRSDMDVTFTFWDNISGIASASLMISSGGYSNFVNLGTSATESWNFNPTDLPNGPCTLTVIAQNGVGLVSTNTITFNIFNLFWGPLMVGPSPCYADEATEVLIQGLTWTSHIRIFNVTGSLVREITPEELADNFSNDPATSGTFEWNLLNKNEQPVGSGLYLIQVTDEELTAPEIWKMSVVR